MLADPQSLTVGGTAVSLPRTGLGATSADYVTADGIYKFRVQQTTNKTTRRTSITLQSNKIAADPLNAVQTRVSDLASISVVQPLDGFTTTEVKDHIVALATWATTGSAANLIKALGGEK